ncbi:MAG: hypothetical protein LUG50_01130 [Planctomycetaceae bacterium]|nr:hypothetical protein [Planctomycetaceae bacterium]
MSRTLTNGPLISRTTARAKSSWSAVIVSAVRGLTVVGAGSAAATFSFFFVRDDVEEFDAPFFYSGNEHRRQPYTRRHERDAAGVGDGLGQLHARHNLGDG